MKLHELRPTYKNKNKKRIGRGGKRGTYSGRGVKGQKSRAGAKIRKAERDLIIRLPKKRGFKNQPKSIKPLTINLSKLNSLIVDPKRKELIKVNGDFLRQVGFIPIRYRGQIKILGNGIIDTPVIIDGVLVSKNAKVKIERAGGRVV